MKWHIICLLNIVWLYVCPIWIVSFPLTTDREHDNVLAATTVSSSKSSGGVSCPWSQWSAVMLAYAVSPGRVTLCRWRLAWRHSRRASRKRRQLQKPLASPCEGLCLHVATDREDVRAAASRGPSSQPKSTSRERALGPLDGIARWEMV